MRRDTETHGPASAFSRLAGVGYRLEYMQLEREVLAHFARGKSNTGIAEALGVGRVTVRNAIYRVLDKLGVESNRETLVWAVQNGLLEGEEGQGAVGPGS